MFSVLTITREFGAGGGFIARRVAEELRWNLLDDALIREVARAAHVDVETVQRYDERVDAWWRRFHAAGLRAACIYAGLSPPEAELVDTESTIARFTQRVINRAAAKGECVIVGRGAECLLQSRTDTFHVFIYGPSEDRVSRVHNLVRSPSEAVELIRRTDRERAGYIRAHYRCNWTDCHLYHMMISSGIGPEAAVRAIVGMLRDSGVALTCPSDGTDRLNPDVCVA